MEHLSEDELERYHLGMILNGPELDGVEERVDRAERSGAALSRGIGIEYEVYCNFGTCPLLETPAL